MSEDTPKTSHGHYERDYDGRPPVGDFGEDRLLEALRKHHFIVDAPRPPTNPGTPDDTGGSD